MQPYCRHRAEQALNAHWGREASLRESTTMVTALQNPMSFSTHTFLMENLGMHLEQARGIYTEHAPYNCHCDAEAMSEAQAA
ncbi:hypothetical protein [Leptolyngbya sp. FACHB-261]|uniref:hypothetical protein n=1 Tax=Leptolyngbya sp. FACHB-261 TaxID=2692806 RepID=UPI001683F080|nr:hypothetical protein [Leptolyngbya sp. FACHB-261]MBD2101250.1 hypothetical protein [Leptolyngbya sp. FACHB-261]